MRQSIRKSSFVVLAVTVLIFCGFTTNLHAGLVGHWGGNEGDGKTDSTMSHVEHGYVSI